ncbi:MAG TPA: helix-turn-helix transcriptional regulator [Rhizobiales bacterium]|nr:helix-turn-helix transcriptional regulator [Hyphomicrobiales bacterium]
MDGEALSRILKAAGDTTRRRILALLVQEGTLSVTGLAVHFDMSLNSVSKHTKVPEKAWLVARRTVGREHFLAAELQPPRLAEAWFGRSKSIREPRRATSEDAPAAKDDDDHGTRTDGEKEDRGVAQGGVRPWPAPATLATFIRPPEMVPPARVETDPVKGRRFPIVMRSQERQIPHAGTRRVIDRHVHLSFTWESPLSLDDSVTIDFVEVDAGPADGMLRHVRFRSEGGAKRPRAPLDRGPRQSRRCARLTGGPRRPVDLRRLPTRGPEGVLAGPRHFRPCRTPILTFT